MLLTILELTNNETFNSLPLHEHRGSDTLDYRVLLNFEGIGMKIVIVSLLLASAVFAQSKERVLLGLIKDYWEKKDKTQLENIYLDAINYVLDGSDGNLSSKCDLLWNFRTDGILPNERPCLPKRLKVE